MDFFTGKTKQYADLIFDFAKKRIISVDEKENKELAKILKNVLLDLPGPRSLTNVKLNREDQLTSKLFKTFSEIANSFEALQNIYVYINSCPYKKISKYNYLKYHIENYLQELYILRERLDCYLTIVDRIYKKSKIKTPVHKATQLLRPIVNKSFDGYVKIRGSYVHRFRYSDKDIDRLSAIDTLSKSKDSLFIGWSALLYKMAMEMQNI